MSISFQIRHLAWLLLIFTSIMRMNVLKKEQACPYRSRLAAMARPRARFRLTLCISFVISLISAQSTARPNFVFILVDDVAESQMPYASRTLAYIAEQGMTFTSSYVDRPICSPSRASTYTGRYAHSHNVQQNFCGTNSGYCAFMRHEHATLAVHLAAAGYRTGFVGHYMVRWQQSRPATFVPPGWSWWAASRGAENGRLAYNGEERTYAGRSTETFVAYAKEFLTSTDPRPFFLQLSTHDVHDPYTPASQHAGLFPSVVAPRTPAFNEEDVFDLPQWLQREPMTFDQILTTDEAFLGSIRELQSVDEAVKAVVDELTHLGLLTNTYIIFTSDNGYHFGDHRILPKSPPKTLPFETDIRVPLLIRGPGVAAGRAEDRLVASVDIPATILDLAGVALPEFMEGRSLAPLLFGMDTAWRNALPINRWGSPAGRGVRTDRWTYFRTNSGQVILFDNPADPFQLTNLAGRQTHAAVQTELQRLANDFRACRGAVCRVVDKRAPP